MPGARCLFPFPRNVRQPEWPPALTFGLWLRVAELSVGAVPVAVLIRSRTLQAVLRCWFGPQPLLGTALPGQFVCPQVLGGPDQVDCGLFEGVAKVLHGGLAKDALLVCSVAVSGRLAQAVPLSSALLQHAIRFGQACSVSLQSAIAVGRLSVKRAVQRQRFPAWFNVLRCTAGGRRSAGGALVSDAAAVQLRLPLAHPLTDVLTHVPAVVWAQRSVPNTQSFGHLQLQSDPRRRPGQHTLQGERSRKTCRENTCSVPFSLFHNHITDSLRVLTNCFILYFTIIIKKKKES